MKVILDINVLLISLPKVSDYRLIFDALKEGSYELGISNEILFEYEEKLAEKTKVEIAENVVKLLLNLENAVLQNVYFTWQLISPEHEVSMNFPGMRSGSLVFSADAAGEFLIY